MFVLLLLEHTSLRTHFLTLANCAKQKSRIKMRMQHVHTHSHTSTETPDRDPGRESADTAPWHRLRETNVQRSPPTRLFPSFGGCPRDGSCARFGRANAFPAPVPYLSPALDRIQNAGMLPLSGTQWVKLQSRAQLSCSGQMGLLKTFAGAKRIVASRWKWLKNHHVHIRGA